MTSEALDLIILQRPDAVRLPVTEWQRRGERVGFVPTMGALHEGHAHLIRAARAECDRVVVSIFVNPTQFAPHEDLSRYPRPFAADLATCREAGAHLVFHPSPEDMYPRDFATTVSVGELTQVLEGQFRPGHFDGVTTVVLKLFAIVGADIAYFGLKDYQQQLLIRRMVRDLDLPIEIHAVPTVREPDGLAMSSRNVYLTPDERQRALALWESLNLAKDRLRGGERDLKALRQAMRDHLESRGADVDYATVADPETLAELEEPQAEMVVLLAARVGTTRLIDNLPVSLATH